MSAPPGEDERGIFAAVEPWVVQLAGPGAAILYAAFRFRLQLHPTGQLVSSDEEWERWTGLSRTQVLRARAKLVEAELVECSTRKHRGVPMTHWAFGRAVHCAKSNSPGLRDSAQSSSIQEVLEELPTGEPPTAREEPPSLLPAPGFEEFWQAYPRRTDKGAARKAWATATKKTDPAQIVEAAGMYAADPNRDERYTKHPATWLNAEAWGNGPLPSRQAPQHRNVDQNRAVPSGQTRL
jgi:hypothetical protein